MGKIKKVGKERLKNILFTLISGDFY